MIEEVVSVELPVHERLVVRKNRLTNEGNGIDMPRISIVTGTHGDELDGQYICYEIIRRSEREKNKLKGIVDIYPDINPLGLDTGSRGIPMFDLDMNRVFPGDNNGAMAEYVAAGIIEDIIGSELCIDIHSSNIFVNEMPQVRINDDTQEKLLPYAKMMNAQFVWIYSSITVLDATLAYSLNHLGVPTLVTDVILRDFSAPVKLDASYTTEELQHMLSFCDDAFIKVDSAQTMQKRYVHENIKLLEQGGTLKDPVELVESYKALLKSVDKKTDLLLLNETLKIMPVASLMETFDDDIDIDAISRLHNELEQRVAVALEKEFYEIYGRIKAQSVMYSVIDMSRRAISNSALHMLSVAYVATGKADNASALVLRHYNSSANMTDKLQALTDAVHLNLKCKQEILKSFEKDYSKNALAFDNYFRVQATVPDVSAVDNVNELKKHPSYDGNNPNRVRALPGALALSNPVALNDLSGRGYDLLCSEVQRLNSINPSVAARILTPLLSFRRLDAKRQQMIRERLEKLMKIPSISRSIFEKVESALKESK